MAIWQCATIIIIMVMCRFGTDLVLWEPASPAAVSKANAQSVLYSCMDLLQPAATSEERFLMCKSALKEGERWGKYVPASYAQTACGIVLWMMWSWIWTSFDICFVL